MIINLSPIKGCRPEKENKVITFSISFTEPTENWRYFPVSTLRFVSNSNVKELNNSICPADRCRNWKVISPRVLTTKLPSATVNPTSQLANKGSATYSAGVNTVIVPGYCSIVEGICENFVIEWFRICIALLYCCCRVNVRKKSLWCTSPYPSSWRRKEDQRGNGKMISCRSVRLIIYLAVLVAG